MEVLENKILRKHCFSYSDTLDIKQQDRENVFNITTKSKITILFCGIPDSSNPTENRLYSICSWEDYMGFNHPNCHTSLVYYHSTSNERERKDFFTLYI